MTIDGNRILIHGPQGSAQTPQKQPPLSVTILGKNVVITYDPTVSSEHKLAVSKSVQAAADLLNKNADQLSADDKKAIGEITSFRVTESPNTHLGVTGQGSMTLSYKYIDSSSTPWLASTIGHEGQHYLNKEKYSEEDQWRDEQSASKTQLGVGDELGWSKTEHDALVGWMDDKNREAMQEHMKKGYTY